ncbi:hypothetical protein Cal7507_5016 [Calothrix sp. PCC 7507]|nr:hypothetical protein Cal7507_5016 [Calothrix sp. PCC 7507]
MLESMCIALSVAICYLHPNTMLKTLWATVRQGKIELLEPGELPEGTKVLVTLLPDDEGDFWLQTSQVSVDTIWDNTEDDIYAQLLKK